MQSRRALHELARDWHDQFATEHDVDAYVFAGPLGPALKKVGFVADGFSSVPAGFQTTMAFDDQPAAMGMLAAFGEAPDLGNTIFARWQQVDSWGADGWRRHEIRAWFAAAFERLMELTAPLGVVQSFVIHSDEMIWGLVNKGTVSSQQVTVKVGGTGEVVTHTADGSRNVQTMRIDTDALSTMLPALSQLAESAYDSWQVLDVGAWTLQVIGTTGSATYRGPLIDGWDGGLSEQLRDVLPVTDLLLMDGNPHRLQRIVAWYDADDRNSEELAISRSDQALSLTRVTPDETSTLSVTGASVVKLIDDLPRLDGAIPLLEDPKSNLAVTMSYRDADEVTVKGTLTTDALVQGWPEFAGELRLWLRDRRTALLNRRLFGDETPEPGALLYAQVVLHHGEHGYSYLADPQYTVGDRVVVPTQNGELYGTIVSLSYYQPEDAPYPPALTKHISSLADPVAEANGE